MNNAATPLKNHLSAITEIPSPYGRADNGSNTPAFEGADELLFWLLQNWRGGEPLAEMRATAMDRAIQSKDKGDGQEKWNQYVQLAAAPDSYCKARWEAADKVIRHCVIQIHDFETQVDDNQYQENKPNFHDTNYLLAHTQSALKGVKIRQRTPCSCYEDAFTLCFEPELQLTIFNQSVDANTGINTRCNSLNSHKEPLFYTVIDVDGSDPELESEMMLRYYYGTLAGSAASHEAIATKYIGGRRENAATCMTGVTGVVGMEGALFVRNLEKYPRAENDNSLTVASPGNSLFQCNINRLISSCTNHCCFQRLQRYFTARTYATINKNENDTIIKDELWGGAVFQLFLISLFQRKRLELAAKEAAKNWESDDAQSSQQLNKQLKQMMRLDNVWMYQEMAARTDIDSIYRIYQDALDVPQMWSDIRDQMGRASDFLERKSAKTVEKVVTALTVIGLPLAFFTALITVSDINEISASHQFFGAMGIFLLIIPVSFFLWSLKAEQKVLKVGLMHKLKRQFEVKLSRLMRLLLGVVTLILMICGAGILLIESFDFSITFLDRVS